MMFLAPFYCTRLLIGKNIKLFALQTKCCISVKKSYEILGVSENCDDEVLRLAFVNLVKRYHPDSGSNEASTERFLKIKDAYREIQRNRFEEREKKSVQYSQVEEFNIKHTLPQHRHYLHHDIGLGTSNSRQRLHVIERVQKAVENAMEHRLKKVQTDEHKTLVDVDKHYAKDIKTRYGKDRLVEDLIQEAMNKGEFKNLPGMGKPLKENVCTQNPYVDFVTYKMNQILIDNGFTPEWIQLAKEIREDTKKLKIELTNTRNKLNELPLSVEDQYIWENKLHNSLSKVKDINKKIDKYNLIVPILQKQILQINLKSLADDILAIPPDTTVEKSTTHNNSSKITMVSNKTITEFITSLFRK